MKMLIKVRLNKIIIIIKMFNQMIKRMKKKMKNISLLKIYKKNSNQ